MGRVVPKERHRPGPFKQQNKSHKVGKHRSKGQLNEQQKGRVEGKSSKEKSKSKRKASRSERLNQLRQIRRKKVADAAAAKSFVGSTDSPPLLSTVVTLCEDSDPVDVVRILCSGCDPSAVVSGQRLAFVNVEKWKQRQCFVSPSPDNLYEILDVARVSNVVIFVWPVNGKLSSSKAALVSSILAQGLPSAVSVVQGLTGMSQKRKESARKTLLNLLGRWSLEPRLFSVDSEADASSLLRHLGNRRHPLASLTARRPHLLAQSWSIRNVQQDLCTLNVQGYLRGPPLDVNGLVHVSGLGDFQMKEIRLLPDPRPLGLLRWNSMEEEEAEKVLATADPALQTPLESEVPLDSMAGEQTWPSAEELEQADIAEKKRKKRVPAGTSAYQAAWILNSDEEGSEDEEEEEEDMMALDGDDLDKEQEEEEELIEDDSASMATDRFDTEMNEDEDRIQCERFREERSNELFPDEIDTPRETPARVRFQKYRGLKSMRTSDWDPLENLPTEYARIFQFANFKRTKKAVLSMERAGALNGWFLSIDIDRVPVAELNAMSPDRPLVVFGLLPHEHKISLLNLVVRKHPSCGAVVRSKDRLIFQVGYRRFCARPIFSQHTNGRKHKMERFLGADQTVIASIFAPIIFPPASVLVFRENRRGEHQLVGTGRVLDLNPNRVVIKRLVLSGHPYKITGRTAVVRFMFFNREDILWFKPVELRTKFGRRGHIKEPLGTHGHMKCVFDGCLKSQDTIMMTLYKRVFPKWTFDPFVPADAPLCSLSNATSSQTVQSMET